MILCCDFCETQAEGDAHMARLRARYGINEKGHPIVAPAGWVLLPFGAPIPSAHREYLKDVGWAYPRRCHSTMTPMSARPSGHALAYATPQT